MKAHDFEYDCGDFDTDGFWTLKGSNIHIQDSLKYTGYYVVYRDDTDTDGSITFLAETKTLGDAMVFARKEAQQ